MLLVFVPCPWLLAIPCLPSSSCAGKWDIVRQQIFCNSDFWPCGPYPMDGEEEDGAPYADDGDGWVHYDTSNWKPPAP